MVKPALCSTRSLTVLSNTRKNSFFSTHMKKTAKHLALKVLINMSEHCFDETNNFARFENLMKNNKFDNPDIEKAVKELETMTSNRRL